MLTLRQACLNRFPVYASAVDLAHANGFRPPCGLRDVLLAADSVVFEHRISTPAGTALGGWVELRIAANGSYTFKGHLHGSGFDPYSFRIHLGVRGGVLGLSLRKTGSVGGTTGGGSRDFDWTETGHSDALRRRWNELRDGQLVVSFDYEDTGVLGALGDVGKAFVHFFTASLVVGGPLAAVLVLGAELAQLADVDFARPGLPAGILVAGSTILLLGPGMVVPAVVAGTAIAVGLKARTMTEEEKAFARRVFADTVPFDRVRVTNLIRYDGRQFVAPNIDGSILVNMGDGYDEPLKPTDSEYVPGTFIHELVHVWQLAYRPWTVDSIPQCLTASFDRDAAYKYEYKGEDWDSMHIEAQASAVGGWFAMFNSGCGPASPGEPEDCLDRSFAVASPLYRYISQHIRLATG